MKRFAVYPGYSDGVYVSFDSLVRLYGVDADECVNMSCPACRTEFFTIDLTVLRVQKKLEDYANYGLRCQDVGHGSEL